MTWRMLERFRPPHGRTATAFAAHDSGGVTVFSVISFAMLMMLVGLVVDVGRVMNVHSQVNYYADRVALAAAAQLDGRPGALTRAKDAALGVVEDLRFSLSGNTDIGIDKLTFLSHLGPDPADPFARSPTPDDVVVAEWSASEGGDLTDTVANAKARFVIVDTTEETEEFIFFPLLAALTPGPALENATVAPQAVARFERQVCNIAPLMVCNPRELAGDVDAPFVPAIERGQMIIARLQNGTGSGSWGPGAYSMMRPTNVSLDWDRDDLQRYMGRISQNIGCFGSSIIVERNDTDFADRRDGINEGLNVRFDMYHGEMYNEHDDPNYAPAANVAKGLLTDDDDGSDDACRNTVSPDTIPFPRGDGWDRMTYWNTNFLPTYGPSPPNLQDEAGTPYLGATRYQIYRDEIDRSPPRRVHPPGTNEDDEPQLDLDHEYGRKSCWHLTEDPDAPRSPPHPDTSPLRDRRVLPVAVVNCLEHAAVLATGEDSERVVPVAAYAEMFLTEPAGDPRSSGGAPQGDQIYLEVVGPVRSALPDEVLREFSVLSR